MPPVAAIEAWIDQHTAACRAGDLAAMQRWRDDFTAWCDERKVNPIAAVRHAALAKVAGLAG
jgi:hypothetical protein